jgi:hypothetical protein
VNPELFIMTLLLLVAAMGVIMSIAFTLDRAAKLLKAKRHQPPQPTEEKDND